MTTQKKNSRLSALAILCQMLCLLMAFAVALPSAAESVYAEAANGAVIAEGGILSLLGDCAQIISALAVIVAAWIAGRQFLDNKHLESVKFVFQVLMEIASDETMQDTLRKIECYTRPEDFDVKSQDIDRLLTHLARLAIAWKENVVKGEALVVVKYYVCVTMNNLSVKRHVGNLDLMENVHTGVQTHPYKVLMDLRDFLEKEYPDKNRGEDGG